MYHRLVRALVSAFEPFGGDSVNASLEALRCLPHRLDGIEIFKVQLPTSFARALSVLKEGLEQAKPELVLCLGQANTRDKFSLERIAVNVQDARIADNDGSQPKNEPVRAGGPTAYRATLPLQQALAALHAAGIPAEISESAGTFVCNSVFYGLMDHLAHERRNVPAGFAHLPALDKQSAEALARGVSVVLVTAGCSAIYP